jgi:LPXTG-motif cell wall-anchored protein
MFDTLTLYFNEEKTESIWFVLIGVISIALSAWLFFKFKNEFYRGLVIPVVLISLIQITVGSSVYIRTDNQIAKIVSGLQDDKQTTKPVEITRMNDVMKNFKIYKWIEIAFILSGVLILVFLKDRYFWTGIGAGLLIEGTFMIVLDVIAEMRGVKYLEWLQQF